MKASVKTASQAIASAGMDRSQWLTETARKHQFVDEAPDEDFSVEEAAPVAEVEHTNNGPDDALGLYLRQMGSIPLLKRDQELALALRLEVTRRRYRRALLFSWQTLDKVAGVFQRIHAGLQPLDPMIDVVNSLQLTREQILARIPHNLKTVTRLLQTSRRDFKLFQRTRSEIGHRRMRQSLRRNLRKAITLIEEISPRTEVLDHFVDEYFQFVDSIRGAFEPNNPGVYMRSGQMEVLDQSADLRSQGGFLFRQRPVTFSGDAFVSKLAMDIFLVLA